MYVLIKTVNKTWKALKTMRSTSKKKSSGHYNDDPLMFIRSICEEVKVVKVGKKLSVTTRKRLSTMDFDSPPSVPESLRDLVSIVLTPDIFPDYNKYLDKSVILCE